MLVTSTIVDGTYQPAIGSPDSVFSELLAANPNNNDTQAWRSFLLALARDREPEPQKPRVSAIDTPSCETTAPLQKILSPGPWVSLGGYFDYRDWSDRERFMELDRAIRARHGARGSSMDEDREAA